MAGWSFNSHSSPSPTPSRVLVFFMRVAAPYRPNSAERLALLIDGLCKAVAATAFGAC